MHREPEAELLVADSFRARRCPVSHRTEVRGFPLHLDRFSDGVADALRLLEEGGVETPDDWWELTFLPFMERVPAELEEAGDGFPRLELWLTAEGPAGYSEPGLSLALATRPLPRLGGRLALKSTPAPQREAPWIKGPNIATHTALNRACEAEALLLDSDGTVIEGATTSIIWWDTVEDRGYIAPPASETQSRINSVTEALLDAVAPRRPAGRRRRADDALRLVPARITPEELAGREVWAVNALHGIRVVDSLDGSPTRPPRSHRIAWFRDALEDTWVSVLGTEDPDDESTGDDDGF